MAALTRAAVSFVTLLAIVAGCTAFDSTSGSGGNTTVGHFSINPNVTMTLSSDTVPGESKRITVTWTGVPNPTEQDAIVLYVPAHATVEYTVPAKYKWVNTLKGYKSGSGRTTFKVLNQRQNAIFYYFYNVTIAQGGVVDPLENTAPTGFLSPNVIAKTKKIIVSNTYPTQIHMAYTNASGEVLAQWTTGVQPNFPSVYWGLSSKNLTGFSVGGSQTYGRNDMCGTPANTTGYLFPGFLNNALMSNLLPNTQYFYKVADNGIAPINGAIVGGVQGPTLTFVTPPAPGPDGAVKFIVWADSGQATDDASDVWEWSDNDPVVTTAPGTPQGIIAEFVDVWQQDQGQQGASLNLTRRIAQELEDITLLIHNGDISYARGSVTQWDVFMNQYKKLFQNVPYMTLPGNHERDYPNTGDRYWPLHNAYDSGGECGVAYERRFQMPQPGVGLQWYGFDYGPIHFLQISTEQPFGAGSPQWLYILKDLMSVDRSVTPWVVVGMHRPIYTSSIYGHDFQSDVNVANDLQTSLEEIFFLYEVDMTWSGHVHMYERTCPVLKKQCVGYAADATANAPIHMCMGHGGFEFTWFMNPTPPSYWDAVFMEHGYLRVTASRTELHLTAVSSNTGNVMDDFKLTKPYDWKPLGASAKKHTLDYFISNYTVQHFYEFPGVSSDALWSTPLFIPAAPLLFSNTTALKEIAKNKPEFIANINVGDTVPNLASVFRYYYQEFKTREFQAATTEPEVANAYLNGIIFPLLEFFFDNTAKAIANKSFDVGTVKGPQNNGAPGRKTKPILPGTAP